MIAGSDWAVPRPLGKAKGTKEWPTPPVRQPRRFVLQMVVWGAKAEPPVCSIFPAALLYNVLRESALCRVVQIGRE